MLDKNAKIYVAGHRGLVGSAIWKNLEEKGYTNLSQPRPHTERSFLIATGGCHCAASSTN